MSDDATTLITRQPLNFMCLVSYTPDEMKIIREEFKRMSLKLEVATALVAHHRAQVAEYQAELARVTEKLITVETAYQAVCDATRGGG